MICNICAFVDDKHPTPETTPKHHSNFIANCPKCSNPVWAIGTTKEKETSKQLTVDEGERREIILSDDIIKFLGADSHHKSGDIHIDRVALREDGTIFRYFEVKERTCSINGYKITLFPYNKIIKAQEITRETGIPVYIFIKFCDCWAKLWVDPTFEYDKGGEPLAPEYRPKQGYSKEQYPALIYVEKLLEIIKIN